jgi:hypothetical protein
MRSVALPVLPEVLHRTKEAVRHRLANMLNNIPAPDLQSALFNLPSIPHLVHAARMGAQTHTLLPPLFQTTLVAAPPASGQIHIHILSTNCNVSPDLFSSSRRLLADLSISFHNRRTVSCCPDRLAFTFRAQITRRLTVNLKLWMQCGAHKTPKLNQNKVCCAVFLDPLGMNRCFRIEAEKQATCYMCVCL